MRNLRLAQQIGLVVNLATVILLGNFAALDVKAASQTWTNDPVDALWNTAANWFGNAVPGAVNSTTTADIATFTNALPLSGIGGAANPIIIDDTRSIKNLTFDGPSCGAYVIGVNDGVTRLGMVVTTTANPGIINVGSAVTNPISIMGILQSRLASSQNGLWNITNNATSPGATLFINQIFNTSATTRPLTLNLGGSNTGTNTVGQILDGATLGANGAIHVNKIGTGTWVLAGANDIPQRTSGGDNIPGSVNVNAGTLIVKDPGSLGAITVANLLVQTNGVLQIDGVTLNNGGIGLRQNGTIRMNGSGTVNGVTVGNAPATSVTLATTGASDILTIGDSAAKLLGGAADTVLHVAGPGATLLPFSSTYIGKWSLDAGTTQIGDPAALGTGANVHIAAGALLTTTNLGAVTYTLGTAAISAGGTGTALGSTAAAISADAAGTNDLGSKAISLTFTPTTFNGDTAHPALYVAQGTLALGGNSITVSNASGSPLGAGTYRLIQQAVGNIASGGNFAVTVTGSGLAANGVASIEVVGGNLNLVVISYVPKNLVWTGGNPNSTWDSGTTANWLNGAAHSVFNTSDSATFNSVGSTNPTVNLPGTVSPSTVKVDTSANDYTLSGSGQIAGATSLTKVGSGTLLLQTTNAYSGGTVISNGTLRLGGDNAIPSTGAGDVMLFTPGILDLNGFNDTINALIGNGTVDIQNGAQSTLTIGNNDNSGTFSGVLKNTSGILGLTKAGNGVETLTAGNTYTGPTVINAGTLRTTNVNALGSGGSAVTINNGALDLGADLVIASLSGTGGTIVNNSSSATNTLIIQGTSTYGGLIADGSTGRIGIRVNAGTLRLDANNTFSGGTILAEGAGLSFGSLGQAGSGGVIASNSTTVAMLAQNPSSAIGTAITTADGATVTFTSVNTANSWNGQFRGGTTATNVFAGGNTSIGGTLSFANFLGTVVITNGGIRWFTAMNGGDNTLFHFVNGGGCFTRDATTVRLGALTGNGAITAPSVTPPGTYWIGAKGVDSAYEGTFTGANNFVKVGPARLTFDGLTATTNTDGGTYTNYLYGDSLITYTGNTTISNGVLTLVVPNSLSNSPNLTLAGTAAVLDASRMGYVSNLVDVSLVPTNSILVTNGTVYLALGQRLRGFGTVWGSLVADAGTFLNPGNVTAAVTPGAGTGELNVTNVASIAGEVNLRINRTNTPNADLLAARVINVDSNSATLIVANVGDEPLAWDKFKLTSVPITGGFANITLPPLADPDLYWSNRLSTDGTLVVASLTIPPTTVNTTPTNIVFQKTGNTLDLSWPADHIGWQLRVQTNNQAQGVSTNLSDWGVVPNSTTTNRVIVPIDVAKPTEFYRLFYQP